MSKKIHLVSVATCTLLVLGHTTDAQTPTTASSGDQVTVPFSDASRPGTVKVTVLTGSISVKVGTGRDVVVTTTSSERDRDDNRDRTSRDRRGSGSGRGSGSNDSPTAGLRRLSQPAGVHIEEESNVVSITAPALTGHVSVSIQVPAATSLVLRAVNGGEVAVDGVNGSIEVNNVNGSIRLNDVGGAVIAHATNGTVVATVRQIPSGKPMSFTSFNGNVDVTLPGAAKANLKMRSDRGDVYTDFDVQTSPAPRTPPGDVRRFDGRNRGSDDSKDKDSKDKPKYRLEMDRSIYGTVNGGGADFELRTFNGDLILRKAK